MIDLSSFSHIVNLQSPNASDAGPFTEQPMHYRLLPKSMLDELSVKSSSPNKKDEQFFKSALFKSRSPAHKKFTSELRASPLRHPSSQKRKVSQQSPVQVNTAYELTLRNTRNLWQDFETHLRSSVNKQQVSPPAMLMPKMSSLSPKKNSVHSNSASPSRANRLLGSVSYESHNNGNKKNTIRNSYREVQNSNQNRLAYKLSTPLNDYNSNPSIPFADQQKIRTQNLNRQVEMLEPTTPERFSEPEIAADSVEKELQSEARINKMTANRLIQDELMCSPNRFKKFDSKKVQFDIVVKTPLESKLNKTKIKKKEAKPITQQKIINQKKNMTKIKPVTKPMKQNYATVPRKVLVSQRSSSSEKIAEQPQCNDYRKMLVEMVGKLQKTKDEKQRRSNSLAHIQVTQQPTTYQTILSSRLFSPSNDVRKQVTSTLNQILLQRFRNKSTKSLVPFLPNYKAPQVQTQITKLIHCEKSLQQLSNCLFLRLLTSNLLASLYMAQKDNSRTLRYIESIPQATWAEAAQDSNNQISSFYLNLLALKSECLLLEDQFEQSLACYSQVGKLFNVRVKYADQNKENQDVDMPAEAFCFGTDEYIKVNAGIAECLFKLGKTEKAIEKFEAVKRRISQEIVFDKPVMLINCHNQLGNCYLKLGNLDQAKANFEQSVLLIQKLDDTTEYISDKIVSTIYLNLAVIASSQDQPEDSILLHERCLEIKRNYLQPAHEDFMTSYCLLATESLKLGHFDSSIHFFDNAYLICRTLKGDYSEETAQCLINIANAQCKAGRNKEASDLFEQASLILAHQEKSDKATQKNQSLNKVYLQLINLYLCQSRQAEAQYLIEQLEIRLEIQLEDPQTFKLMNELANTIRKHDNFPLAVSLYKKALLSLKTRFKNSYLLKRDTSRILINIASTEFMRLNFLEASRYYEHALSVLGQVEGEDATKWIDMAKVHVSLAQISRQQHDQQLAFQQFHSAQECLEKGGEVSLASTQIAVEIRKQLKEMV